MSKEKKDKTKKNKRKDVSVKANSNDLVRDYLMEIGEYPLLSTEEEIKYGKIIKENPEAINYLKENIDFSDDKDKTLKLIEEKEKELKMAKQNMVNSNLRLVVSIAKHYVGKGLLLLDLIQEGNLGLIRAVDKFDYTLGYKFSTYATWWIRQAITRGIGDYGRTIRLPIHLYDKINKLKYIEFIYLNTYNRVPTVEEFAAEMELPVDSIIKLLKYKEEPVSLNSYLIDDESGELLEFIRDEYVDVENEVIKLFDLQYTIDLLKNTGLSDREKFILLYRNGYSREDIVKALGEDAVAYIELSSRKRHVDVNWGVPNTLEDTARIYGVTRERIRQIQEKAKDKLKKFLLRDNPDLVLAYAPVSSVEHSKALSRIKDDRVQSNEDRQPTITSQSNYIEYKSPIVKNSHDNSKRKSLRN